MRDFTVLHEPLFCNFLWCTAASGPYLVANRKALILHEQNIDHGKIFKWWSCSSHCAQWGQGSETGLGTLTLENNVLDFRLKWNWTKASKHIYLISCQNKRPLILLFLETWRHKIVHLEKGMHPWIRAFTPGVDSKWSKINFLSPNSWCQLKEYPFCILVTCREKFKFWSSIFFTTQQKVTYRNFLG